MLLTCLRREITMARGRGKCRSRFYNSWNSATLKFSCCLKEQSGIMPVASTVFALVPHWPEASKLSSSPQATTERIKSWHGSSYMRINSLPGWNWVQKLGPYSGFTSMPHPAESAYAGLTLSRIPLLKRMLADRVSCLQRLRCQSQKAYGVHIVYARLA